MIQHVFMPKLGQTMEEATVEKWHRKEGDRVERGEVLLEITTDKATLEVESYVGGILRKIIAPEGATLPVNAVIALVGEPEDPLPDNLDELVAAAKAGTPSGLPGEKTEAAEAPTTAEVEAAPLLPAGRIFASPRARMRAKEMKVNLRLVRGTGPAGRITEKDVLDHGDRLEKIAITPAAREIAYQRGVDITRLARRAGRITKEDVLAATPPALPGPAESFEPPSAMRRIVAERLARSKREIPHFYITMDVDMTEAVALRTKLNEGREPGMAFHDLIIRACAIAMHEQPAMHVAWRETRILRRATIDIGLAVALDEGLIVPVVRNADRLRLEELAAESRRLIERARGKRLTPDEYEGGGFTVSNLGMFGADSFTPIIDPSESTILGVGRIAKKPAVVGDAIQIRRMMNLTLSADHRVIDGAVAAKFLARVKELLENPAQLPQ